MEAPRTSGNVPLPGAQAMTRIRKTSGGFGVIPATETSPRKSLPVMQDRRSQRSIDAGRCGEKYPEEYWAERPGFIGAVCHEPDEHRIHRDFTLGVQWL